jgi:hypothetical protein
MEQELIHDMGNMMKSFGLMNSFLENLNFFYQNQLVENLDENMINLVLSFIEDDIDEKKRLLYHTFSTRDLKDFILQKALRLRYFNLMIYFALNYDPSNSALPLDFLITDMIQYSLKPETKPKASEKIYEIFWYIHQNCIATKTGANVITNRDNSWMVFSWILDVKIATEMIKVDPAVFFACFKFLLEEGICKEFEKLQEGVIKVDVNSRKNFSILTDSSNFYLAYLFENFYKICQGKPAEKYVYLFLTSLIMDDVEGTDFWISQHYKIEIFANLMEFYDIIAQDEGIELGQDDVILLILGVFLKEKQFFKYSKKVKQKVFETRE